MKYALLSAGSKKEKTLLRPDSPAARGRYTYHIEGQFHFGFILFL